MVANDPVSDDQAGEQRYRHLFEHLPICIFIADLTVTPATIIDANRRAELVYGYTTAELVGMPVLNLIPLEAKPTATTISQRVLLGQTLTAVTTHQRRDRTSFPVRMTAAPNPIDVSRMIIAVEDITTEVQRRSEAEAIDAERRRIAHEVHDGVAQSLAGLRFKTAFWQHLAEQASPEMRAALDELQVELNKAIVELRRAIFALRPVDLEALGFYPALTQLVSDFGDHFQVAVVLEAPEPHDALPAIYELPLFRILQEGLNNIGQHAQASSVLVRLIVDMAGSVILTVHDNGCGFNPGQFDTVDRAGHFGLHQMRERILDLGGTLDIHSAPDQGTELVITLPPVMQVVNHAVN